MARDFNVYRALNTPTRIQTAYGYDALGSRQRILRGYVYDEAGDLRQIFPGFIERSVGLSSHLNTALNLGWIRYFYNACEIYAYSGQWYRTRNWLYDPPYVAGPATSPRPYILRFETIPDGANFTVSFQLTGFGGVDPGRNFWSLFTVYANSIRYDYYSSDASYSWNSGLSTATWAWTRSTRPGLNAEVPVELWRPV